MLSMHVRMEYAATECASNDTGTAAFLSWRYDLAYMGCGVILWAGPTWRIGLEHCVYYSHEANR